MIKSTHKGTALIAGASSSIGAAYADRLADAGYDLVLVAHRAERLRPLAEEIATRTGRSIRTVAADLADKADLAKVADVLRSDASITLLINNAGVDATAPLQQSDVCDTERTIALNASVLTHLAYAAASAFVDRGHGTIFNIASMVATAPENLKNVYGGSAAYVLAFSQYLRKEFCDKGVRIHAVLPRTNPGAFGDTAGEQDDCLPTELSPDDMVNAALADLT